MPGIFFCPGANSSMEEQNAPEEITDPTAEPAAEIPPQSLQNYLQETAPEIVTQLKAEQTKPTKQAKTAKPSKQAKPPKPAKTKSREAKTINFTLVEFAAVDKCFQYRLANGMVSDWNQFLRQMVQHTLSGRYLKNGFGTPPDANVNLSNTF